MQSGSRKVGLRNDRIVPKFDKSLDNTAAEAPVKFPGDFIVATVNPHLLADL